MKKTILLLLSVLSAAGTVSAQDTLATRHNELGLDFTPFVKFYLNFGQNG